MSWQLAAFALLGLGLTAGFVWYERGRPDARIVALVGTLAAFAALGRIAFAALPNVKPTTDIVLISGYALGGAPGFVVGAVAALTSNFFFGQGPWTPWQMAGWGLTGLLGAGLAVVTRGRIGRWPLAAISFVIGFAFTALQDVGDWVTYSDHSLPQLGVYVGKGVGFDLVHATGCLLFALAFGPAMVGSLGRFRQRLAVKWIPPVAAPLILVALALGLTLHPLPARASASPVTYLLSAQNSDGGFGAARGQASASLFSGWAALGLAASGQSPADVSRGGVTLLDYLQRHPGGDAGSLERSILAIHSGGAPVHALASRLKGDIRADGSISEQTNLTAFAVLALRAAGITQRRATIHWLVHQQDHDGGFNFATAPGQSDVDDTGAVLEALAGTGHRRAVARAVRFLAHHQNRDGGFPSQAGGSSNAQSTAFAVQGLTAVRGTLTALRRSPIAYLQSLIGADGHVAYARGQDQTPVWVTAQAELALAGKPLPITAPRGRAVAPVSHRPPARGRTDRVRKPPVAARAARTAEHRSRTRRRQPGRLARRPLALSPLSADAGVVTALVLAPLNM